MFGGGLFGNFGGMFRQRSNELAEKMRQDATMENMLATAAEKTARDQMATRTAALTPESWDFSEFAKTYDAGNFTRGQLMANNLANYGAKDIADDAVMDAPATELNGKIAPLKLQMLAFALTNHADYDAKDNRIVFGGGALELNYLEGAPLAVAANIVNVAEKVQNPLGALLNPDAQIHLTDKQAMAGRVLIRAKLNRNVPNMVVNPASGVKLPTADYVAQKIATEGGNDHFNIFVSPDYGTDALYIFTPDVLAVMDEYGVNFAYKFYDDEVEIYAPAEVLRDGESFRAACVLAVNLARQIGTQAARYKDERATEFAQAHGNLATAGRRMSLRTGLTVGGAIVVGLWIFFDYILPLILQIAGR